MTDAAVSELDALIGQPWKKPPLIKRAWLRWALALGAVVYLVAGDRLDRGQLDAGLRRPGPRRGTSSRRSSRPISSPAGGDIWDGMLESIIMTVAASVVGIADLDPDRAGRRAQHRAAAGLSDLPRHHRDQPRAAGDHRRDPAGGDLRLRPAGRVPDAVLRHHRLPVEAAGRGYRGHGPGPGRGDPRHRRRAGCNGSTTACSRRSCRA